MIDKIEPSLKDLVINVSQEYDRLHSEIRQIQVKIEDLSRHRDLISRQLDQCRNSEIELINKIEEQSGVKMTPSIIKLIIDEKSKG